MFLTDKPDDEAEWVEGYGRSACALEQYSSAFHIWFARTRFSFQLSTNLLVQHTLPISYFLFFF